MVKIMKQYLIQCREIILYIVIDFDPEIGDEFRAGAFDFTLIEKPARSEALFCLEDEYGSVWHAWDYTGNNTCLVAHRLKQTKTVADSALTDANDTNVASMKDQIKTICDLYEEGKDCLHTLPIGQFHGEEMKAHTRAFDVIRELRDIAATGAKRIEELEQWKEEELFVWGPVLDYCHDEANAKRLSIGLGQSISTRILEILKGIK